KIRSETKYRMAAIPRGTSADYARQLENSKRSSAAMARRLLLAEGVEAHDLRAAIVLLGLVVAGLRGGRRNRCRRLRLQLRRRRWLRWGAARLRCRLRLRGCRLVLGFARHARFFRRRRTQCWAAAVGALGSASGKTLAHAFAGFRLDVRILELQAVAHARIEEHADRRERNDEALGDAVERQFHFEAVVG